MRGSAHAGLWLTLRVTALAAAALIGSATAFAAPPNPETTIYFMTNRLRLAKPGISAKDYLTGYFPPMDNSPFGAERASKSELCKINVCLPRAKNAGGTVATLPGMFGKDDAFPDPTCDAVTLDEVWADTTDLVIYVHGFNNTIRDAALTAALYQCEMPPGFRVLAYSWPAIDRVETYLADRESADWTVRDFRRLLSALVERRDARASKRRPMGIHVIAHSTGAYVTLTALREMAMLSGAATRPDGAKPVVDHLVLAAADVEANWFEERIVRENALCMVRQLTNYYTTDDTVLNVSKLVRDPNVFGRYRNRYLRLGQTQPSLSDDEFKRVEMIAVIKPRAYFSLVSRRSRNGRNTLHSPTRSPNAARR